MKRISLFTTLALVVLFMFLNAPTLSAAPEATFVVNTTTFAPNDGVCDATLCTLSEAIESANSHSGKDKITFNIPVHRGNACNAATGVCTLQMEGSLPAITAPLILDGYTQPGAKPNSLAVGMNTKIKIVLRGQGVVDPIGDGLVLMGFFQNDGSVIKGLALTNFVHAIYLVSDNNLIIGNFIGMKPDGVTPEPNWVGIRSEGQTNNKIGGAAFSHLLEFFSSPSCDESGCGEGKNYLGTLKVKTNGNGNVNFTFAADKILLAGTQVTATATNTARNGAIPLSTSEFSQCKAAQ